MSPVASHFVAGVLEHLPGLMAITAPTPNSYRRLQPCTWSGAYKVKRIGGYLLVVIIVYGRGFKVIISANVRSLAAVGLCIRGLVY